ncbi:Pheromone-processing carboxypeptidase, partial [Hortaea werneckii]
LHINPDKKTGWEECNGQVGNAFKAWHSKPSVTLLPRILETVPIVLFSGDQDLICNHIGTENLISSLEWNGAKGMETEPGHWAPKRDWTFEGEPAGTYQASRNLTYVKFYNSSHMVPFDYPRRTRDMLDRFMGVDIASIGGQPADSRIDGEKTAPDTSVAKNSTLAQEAEDEKVAAAKWSAYRRSGEVALVFMVIAVSIWGYFIIRARRRRAGYKSVFGADPYEGGLGLDGGSSSRSKFREERDVEEAREYDEAELDDLGDKRRREDGRMEEDHFDVGDDEDEEDERSGRVGNGRVR